VVEDLNVKGMLRNKHLAKAISEQCFNKFITILGHKCKWRGIELVKADRFFPSSKRCSCCGTIKKDLRLKDRTYICINDKCNFVIDRDKNASFNLARYKLA
ncbi:MAG: RNA-guided endonuclease InsQ/TnpB family protein, partial [Sarcina sp.]